MSSWEYDESKSKLPGRGRHKNVKSIALSLLEEVGASFRCEKAGIGLANHGDDDNGEDKVATNPTGILRVFLA